MDARKRPRNNNSCSPPPTTASPTLPADLLLKIAACSDAGTLVRCAATCKTLRHSIFTADFIQQEAAGVLPTRVLASLDVPRYKSRYRSSKRLVNLLHPTTPVASSFVDNHLAPFLSRRAAALLCTYGPVMSRRGLILLRRRRLLKRHKISRGTNICVYDPMTDARTFLSEPPGISMDDNYFTTSCVLLTAADGIGCSSFVLVVADMSIRTNDVRRTVRIQTASSSDANIMSWGPVTEYVCHSAPFHDYSHAVVLPGGLIHWLPQHERTILTYDVRTRIVGIITCPSIPGQQHLAASSDGKLRILAIDRFVISTWLQHSADGWAREYVIDTEGKIMSIDPHGFSRGLGLNPLKLWSSGEVRCNAVLLQIRWLGIILDLETREMRTVSLPTFLFEVDMPARLHAMKDFS